MTPILFAILLAAADPNGGPGSPHATVEPALVARQHAENVKNGPDKLVCRSEEQEGTRVRARKCMTQAQWDQQEEQVRQYFQDAHDHGGLTAGGGNPMQPR